MMATRSHRRGLEVVGMALWACILGTAWAACAWGSWISRPEGVSLADERASWARPRAPYRLVFYDNARYPVNPENGLPVAVWEHPDFSPMVAVPANVWVGVSVFRSASAESALADRIYANVQLQLILEEYERLQQRAREVLEGLGLHPITVNLASPLATGGLQPQRTEPETRPTQGAASPEPLETRLARLLAAYRQAATDGAAPSPGDGESPSAIFLAMTASVSHGGAEGGGSSEGVSRTAARSGAAGGSASSAEGGTQGTFGGPSFNTPPAAEPWRVPPDLGPALGMSRPIGEDEPLPWILRAALALVRFVFTYKVEILATVLFFFAAFWIVAAIVTAKRKRI